MLREYIYLTDDEIQLTPICEDCGPNAVPIMRKEELIQRDDLVMFEETPQEPKSEPQSDEKEEEADPDVQTVPLKKPGRKPGIPNQTKKEADHGKIIALWKAGWSAKKIAGEMYLSEATIYNHINREKNGNDTN